MFSDSLKSDFSVSHRNQNASNVALHTLRHSTWNLCLKLFCCFVTVFSNILYITSQMVEFSFLNLYSGLISLKRILVILVLNLLVLLKQIFNLSTRENFTV